MALIKYNLINVQVLGIPTPKYIELDDVEQLEEGKCYNIGIMEWPNLLYERKCTRLDSCSDYIKELHRIYGKDSKIYFVESNPSEVQYLFTLYDKGQYELDVDFTTEEDRQEIHSWFDRLSEDYDFSNPIHGVISRDMYGKLFISSIT